MRETVSVIMPLYNGLPYVKEAVESVEKQSIPNWELWVIDDASDDGSAEYIKEKMQEDGRIHLLCNGKNRGVSFSRNLGIEASEGEYIAFLDSDDVWYPEKLENSLQL